MKTIKVKDSVIENRWKSITLAVMESHFPDGMTVDDFMSMHQRAPREVIEKIIDSLIMNNEVDEVK